jgi:putative resolvase
MNKFLSFQKAAVFLGVSAQTLRRWERSKKIEPTQRTAGGQRRYDITKLQPARLLNAKTESLPTIAYARVSSHDQKDDLQRQAHMLEMYCSSQGFKRAIRCYQTAGVSLSK